MDVTVLEEKHILSIIMYLTRGPCTKMDIYNNVSKNPRMPDKLMRLQELGLLDMEKDPVTRVTIVALTSKGQVLGTILKAVEKL